ncbi:hypothetical protein B9Z55_016223 [Caenorhabditis nigoni]|uniref:Uncharacterized protein n=1 Tax=Caenorhabditis nigoni TaxID=1611254 RepID=A0A2G5UEA8_9PELO|nr:hypothetical protein B9Z55_016223 [Caenorhabditis nigoni]
MHCCQPTDVNNYGSPLNSTTNNRHRQSLRLSGPESHNRGEEMMRSWCTTTDHRRRRRGCGNRVEDNKLCNMLMET